MTVSPLDLQVNLSHQLEVAQQHHVEQNRPLDMQHYLAVRMRVEAKREETRIQPTSNADEEKRVDERQRKEKNWKRRRREKQGREKAKAAKEIGSERGFVIDIVG